MVCPWFLASLFWHCCNVCFPSEYACLQVKYLLDEKKAIIKISIHYLENKLMYLSSLCKVITSSYQHKFLIVFISWFYFFFIQVTYHFFHWKKGTPFADDQGIYNRLTWWEQIDSGKQLTRNRKFLTVVPVVL